MKNLQNLLKESNTVQSQLLAATKGLVKQWEPTGLLEGLNSEYEVGGMAVLLENQKNQLIKEASRVGGTGTEEWAGVALPLVRRMLGQIAAKEFVSVQPMNLPNGLVFFLDIKYGSGGQPGFTQNSSIFGGTGTLFGRTDEATGGLYGSGRFGYTSNDYTSSSISASIASGSWYNTSYNTDLSASAAANQLWLVTISLGTDADEYGARAFEPLSASAAVTYFPEYTAATRTASSVDVTFLVSGSAGGFPVANWGAAYHKQPIASDRGDFEDTSVSGSHVALDIPDLDIELQQESIVSKTKKLKAQWTPELVQDLQAYHSIDAEAELTAYLSDYMSAEIDLEILDMLVMGATHTEYWSAKIGYEYNSTTRAFYDAATTGQAYQKDSWFKTLGYKIAKASAIIHQKTMRGGANFMVVSPVVATILENMGGFTSSGSETTQDKFAFGAVKVGSFANQYTVYKNPYMTTNVILMGYKGAQFLDSGAVYAPYIPLIMSPVVYDKDNFTPRRGVMTRYAKKLINGSFYARVVIGDLDAI